jgi:hypothetical protein
MRFKASASGVAIYDEAAAGGDGPFTSPLSHLGNVRFHSSLKYPAIISTKAGLVALLPAVEANLSHQQGDINLFAHGQAGIPYVEGKITSGLSREVALCGSVPVQTCGTGAAGAFPRVVHLGADGTHVKLNWYGTTYELSGFSKLSLTITVYLTDVMLS